MSRQTKIVDFSVFYSKQIRGNEKVIKNVNCQGNQNKSCTLSMLRGRSYTFKRENTELRANNNND
jgi:hypothetical protein